MDIAANWIHSLLAMMLVDNSHIHIRVNYVLSIMDTVRLSDPAFQIFANITCDDCKFNATHGRVISD